MYEWEALSAADAGSPKCITRPTFFYKCLEGFNNRVFFSSDGSYFVLLHSVDINLDINARCNLEIYSCRWIAAEGNAPELEMLVFNRGRIPLSGIHWHPTEPLELCWEGSKLLQVIVNLHRSLSHELVLMLVCNFISLILLVSILSYVSSLLNQRGSLLWANEWQY